MSVNSVLIFGANGMLGRYVTTVLTQSDYQVHPVTRHDLDIGLTDIKEWLDLIATWCRNYSIQAIINCAGITNKRDVSDDTMFKVNTIFPLLVSRWCSLQHIRFYHITTDCVYTGSKGQYTIDDKHDSLDVYGLSKSMGEPTNQKQDDWTCVIRTSIIGECFRAGSLLEWAKLNRGMNVLGFSNHYWSGVTCLRLAQELVTILNKNFAPGLVVWVSSHQDKNYIDKYSLLQEFNRVYQLDLKITAKDTENKCDRSLIGRDLGSIVEQIEELYQFGREYSKELHLVD